MTYIINDVEYRCTFDDAKRIAASKGAKAIFLKGKKQFWNCCDGKWLKTFGCYWF